MAGTIIDMSKIKKQLLQLKKAGISNRQIAKSLKLSPTRQTNMSGVARPESKKTENQSVLPIARAFIILSGYSDSNGGPSAPKADALTNCATPRIPLLPVYPEESGAKV